uniref:Transposase n=1 Tax=Angiostrongylus cantonensis TaxID=6313 RepID=A0A0K0CX36_ANGCA
MWDKECAEIADKLKAVIARRIRVLQQMETIEECIKLMVDVLLAEMRRSSEIRKMIAAEMRRLSAIQEQIGIPPHEERKAEAG